MAKTIEEIKDLLQTQLFQNGLKNNHIKISKDFSKITYNCAKTKTRNILKSEESVQATAYLKLVLEYNYDPQNIRVNEPVVMGTMTKEADIIVYTPNNKKALIVVECKEENINERQFKMAVEQGHSYAQSQTIGSKYVWVTSGIKNEYYELFSDNFVDRFAIADIPKKGKSVLPCKFIKGKKEPQVATQKDLMQKFQSAHNALWGGGALAPTTAFDELDKLIFCKIWDERWESNSPKSKGRPYDFQIIICKPEEDSKEGIEKAKKKTRKELKERIVKLYQKGREKDPEVFKDDIKLSADKIYTVVEYLQDIHLSDTDLDAKGLAFQSFMKEFFRGDFGQFFTPNNIVKFIVDSLEINNEHKVLDTSCGSGGFLLHALKKVREEADELYDKENPKGYKNWHSHWHNFAENNLYGIEINEQISRVAKMNMIIHDDGHTNVITNDGLKSNSKIEKENRNFDFQDGTFDLILTNPPFGAKVKADESHYYKEYELFEKNLGYKETRKRIEDEKKKWRNSQSTEILFLERCYKYLAEGGFMAVVIPDGILTNSSLQYVRDWINDHFRIVCAASLPQTTFSHVNAGVKSSVLFLKKHKKEITDKLKEILESIKDKVRDDKSLAKEEKEEKILTKYKEEFLRLFPEDYNVLMLEIENIGYDATGREINGSELEEASEKIRTFIKKERLIDAEE